jgi:hypothetical protein
LDRKLGGVTVKNYVLMLALLFLTMPAGAKEENGDDLYTSLKRFTDTVEGHPPISEASKDLDMAQSLGYILGMWDGIMVSRVMNREDTSCMKGDISNLALARTVVRYIDNHPKSRGERANFAVTQAVMDAYPCVAIKR